MRANDGADFLTEDEVVARYRQTVTTGTLRNWRSKGLGPPYVHVGKSVLYARADLEAWEAACRVQPSRRPRDEGWSDAASAADDRGSEGRDSSGRRRRAPAG